MAKTPKKKKNQLPSGRFRIQVYDYTDVDGKKHYKSFTAPSKKLAQLAASEWQAEKRSGKTAPDDITVYDAIGRYMEFKKNVLSPSTLRGYKSLHEQYFKGSLGLTRLPELNNTVIQIWVSDLSMQLTPKTVRNAYGLLSATLDMFAPEFRLKVTLPAKQKAELYCPSDEDIKKLLKHIEGKELEIAVLLAAFGPLRRGEICALEDTDIKGNTITISKSMVMNDDKEWIIKQPKTYNSYRTIEMPVFVIEKISGINGRIVKANPDAISNRFRRALKFAGLPSFRFHDLRHYSASIMHAIGVPDQYILQRGGWATDGIMKSVYRNIIDLEAAKQNKKINMHFEEISHEVSHGTR